MRIEYLIITVLAIATTNGAAIDTAHQLDKRGWFTKLAKESAELGATSVGRKAAKEAAEQVVKKSVKEAGEQVVKQSVKEAAGLVVTKGSKHAAKASKSSGSWWNPFSWGKKKKVAPSQTSSRSISVDSPKRKNAVTKVDAPTPKKLEPTSPSLVSLLLSYFSVDLVSAQVYSDV
jgi:hypothetical protein